MPKVLSPGLHVAATPIGNLGDISTRLREALEAADEILCEDTRVTGRLLHHLGIKASLRPYHDHNAEAVRPGILARLLDGGTMVLVSDAGTPLIADPGYKLVREARAAGVPVAALPGPSAVIAALSIAGLPSDRFTFAGFLPPKSGARQTVIEELSHRGETLVFYETAPRLGKALADIAAVCGADCPVVVARELTKLHEEVIEGSASELATRFEGEPTKGEIVLMVAPRSPRAMSDAEVDDAMRQALETMSLKEAAAEVARRTGRKKRDLYQAWIGHTK